MLTGEHIAFLGGDARQLEVIKSCIKQNATVSLIGFDNLQSSFSGANRRELTPDLLETVDRLILPIVGTDESGYIDSLFTSKKIVLTEEHIQVLSPDCVIYAGLAKSYLRNLCDRYGILLIELLKRDDVAIYNSIPTAEGALMMAIQNTDITIHNSQCIVLGLGRVGMTLARTLNKLGAKVRVGIRRQDHSARAFEMGLDPFYLEDLNNQVENVDLLFNTIPALVVDATVIKQMSHQAVVIDLASRPGGVDFQYAEKRGIKALLAPSLPGIVAPKTAGQILARSIIDLIMEDIEKRRGEP